MDMDVGKMSLIAQRNNTCHSGWRNNQNKRICPFQRQPIAHAMWGLGSQMKELTGDEYKRLKTAFEQDH